MSRSSPGPPRYLLGAIAAVERVLSEARPESLTPRQIADRLKDEGFRWPLRDGYVRKPGGLYYRRNAHGDPTPDRVRRVCNMMTGHRANITAVRTGRTLSYTLWP